MKSEDRLIDRIYEVAFVPNLWPDLLQRLADGVKGVGATVFLTNLANVPTWVSSPSIHSVLTDWVSGDWVTRNQRTHRMVAMQHAGFVTTSDVFNDEEWLGDPEHAEFLKPRGLGSSAGTFIPMPTGEIVVYSIERALDLPPMSRSEAIILDGLRPHLARAGAIAARLGLERARSAAETFSHIGLPAISLDGSGRVLAANDLFQQLIPRLFLDARERFKATADTADRLLQQAIFARQLEVAVRSIPIPATESTPPHILHLVPVRRLAHDLFFNVAWIGLCMPVVPATVPGAQVLQGLFDLSPAEARAAREIAAGKTLQDLADSLGLSRETIKTQLRAVFAKTGVSRQVELTALLAGTSLPNT